MTSNPATPVSFKRSQDLNFWLQFYNLGIDEATKSNSATVTYQIIEPVKVRANQVVRPITQIVCKGREHLDQFYNDIVENGGEGVMLRNRFESYEFRRSWNLLKVKPEESGTATIVGYEPGLGKYAGMLGSYLCEWRNEIQFKLSGMVDGERAHPLPIGFKVKFRYQCFTDAGVPRFPRKEN